jgi:membrane-bound lytic murein transglycosylase D
LVVGKKAVVSSPNHPNELTAQQSAGGDGETVNHYYRVRKGDTLGEIAQLNGVRVSQLQAWNGLRNTRIDIGDRLIVQKKVVPRPKEEPVANEYKRVEGKENATSGNDIISSYLKEQIERTGQKEGVEGGDPDAEEEASVGDIIVPAVEVDIKGKEDLPVKK